MKVAIRVDASNAVGSGHFMRCLTLANSLQAVAETTFICRTLPPHLREKLSASGHQLAKLPDAPDANDHRETGDLQHSDWLLVSQEQDAAETVIALNGDVYDWLVVDHYGIDHRWETKLRKFTNHVLIIDDLADREHDCDALVDQNMYPNMESRYTGKVPDACTLFLGAQYAFLRDEFHEQREHVRLRGESVTNLLIYFGGVDADNHTHEAMDALLEAGANEIDVNVVIGAQHPDLHNIEDTCAKQSFNCHIQTSQMAKLMGAADLAIGAGGISAYERLYLRLPAILRPIASNQIEQIDCMAKAGLCAVYENRSDLVAKLCQALSHPMPSPPDCVADGNKVLVAHLINQSAGRVISE